MIDVSNTAQMVTRWLFQQLRKISLAVALTAVGSIVFFFLQAIAEPEIQSWVHDNRCELVDCDLRNAKIFVRSLRLGLSLQSIKVADVISYEETVYLKRKVRNYCNSAAYIRVYLSEADKIQAYFVISKTSAFRPSVPGTKWRIGDSFRSFDPTGDARRKHVTNFSMKEITTSSKSTNWKQLVVSYFPIAYSFEIEDVMRHAMALENPILNMKADSGALIEADNVRVNSFGLSRTGIFMENAAPEWFGDGEHFDFQCE